MFSWCDGLSPHSCPANWNATYSLFRIRLWFSNLAIKTVQSFTFFCNRPGFSWLAVWPSLDWGVGSLGRGVNNSKPSPTVLGEVWFGDPLAFGRKNYSFCIILFDEWELMSLSFPRCFLLGIAGNGFEVQLGGAQLLACGAPHRSRDSAAGRMVTQGHSVARSSMEGWALHEIRPAHGSHLQTDPACRIRPVNCL